MKNVRIWSLPGPYLVRMQASADQKNSKYEHYSRSVKKTVI